MWLLISGCGYYLVGVAIIVVGVALVWESMDLTRVVFQMHGNKKKGAFQIWELHNATHITSP